MPPAAKLHLFAGPTLYRLPPIADSLSDDIELHPPVARDDIAALIDSTAPSSLAIVDGVFYQSLSVGHAELRNALSAGWALWGLSSMGAIRAYEMRQLGMVGYGRIYRMFYDFADFQDDEVSLTHEPEKPYRPISEPLVHLREALNALVTHEVINELESLWIAAELKKRWFADRMWEGLRDLVNAMVSPSRRHLAAALLADVDKYQLKSFDLIDFIAERPWSHPQFVPQSAHDSFAPAATSLSLSRTGFD